MKPHPIRQAVVLAGGQGIRLRPLTLTTPKPMVKIHGKPFLEYIIEQLRENGIEEVVILTGYLHKKIENYFKGGERFGVRIKYFFSPINDETGTRIRKAKHLLENVFLLLYSDNYWSLQLDEMKKFYRDKQTLAMVTIYNNKDGFAEYGYENNIAVNKNGLVTIYDQTRKDKRLNGVDIGFFILNKQVLSLMPEENFSFEKVIFPLLIKKRQLSGFTTDERYYTITNMERLKATEKILEGQRVVFLDRDGVINKNAPPHEYITTWKDFKFLPGAIKGIQLLKKNGFRVIVISNQRGISRGIMSESDLKNIHENMQNRLKKYNAEVDAIYYCPHGSDNGCECRKPKPGMLLRAASEYNFDITQAIFIGDSESDEKAGKEAGCKVIKMKQDGNLLKIVQRMIKNS